MNDQRALEELLRKIDGKGYGMYKELKGMYGFGSYTLAIDHVQADPFAGPSSMRIIMGQEVHGLPKDLYDCKEKCIAVCDFLTRSFRESIFKIYEGVGGSGKSGLLVIDDCGQQVIERTSVMIDEKKLTVSFEVGLPAAGRKVLGRAATEILCKALPKIAEKALIYKNINGAALRKQVELYLDQQYIRRQLKERGLVAFVANGAILPRESGVSDKPLKKDVTAFKAPAHLEVEMDLPYGGKIRGMGIAKGITLIVGGGYHGKSTLLNALQLGVYDHIAGDGREYVIMDKDAVKVRAEDGRSVEKVNISAFINNLPNHKDTLRFASQNASGSTSQAANTMEALEAGASCLLIDEDTSATNFMIRDSRMQQLVKKEKEPITPFIDKVKQLYDEHGVSTILVVGGSGEYFDVADLVIMMDEYVPCDVTERAKAIANSFGQKRETVTGTFGEITHRVPLRASFSGNGKESRIKVRSKECVSVGKSNIELDFVEQLIDYHQTSCLAVMLDYLAQRGINDQSSLTQMIDSLYDEIEKKGLGMLKSVSRGCGNLVLPRKQELFATINRYRQLKIK